MKSLKHILTFACSIVLFAFAIQTNAQAVVSKPLQPKVRGNAKALTKAPKKMRISNFTIFFKTTGWIAEGDAVEGLGMATYLEGLDDNTAQAITNEASEYLIKKLQSHGIEVAPIDGDKLQDSGGWKKDVKKGNARLMNGETYKIESKMASKGPSYTAAVAQGVNIMFLGPDKSAVVGTRNWMVLLGEYDLSITPTIDFVQMLSEGNSTTYKVGAAPELSLTGGVMGKGAYTRYFPKKEVGVVVDPCEVIYQGNEWIGTKEKKEELYGASVHYQIDKAAFQKAVGEMLHLYIDEVVNGIVTTTWGG